MSHTTRRKSAIKDLPALKKAVARIPGAMYQGHGNVKFYSSSASGHKVQLPGWKYPAVFNIDTGECQFDNYEGSWGKEAHLDSLKQGYAIEVARAKAEADGHEVEEMTLEDGSVRLTIPLGGDGGFDVGGGAGAGGFDV